MLNRLASLAMSTRVLKALPGKLDIKRHSPSILYFLPIFFFCSDFMAAAYIQMHFRLLLIIEANTINPDQTAPLGVA